MATVSESRAGGCFGVTSSPMRPPTSTFPIFDDVSANDIPRQYRLNALAGIFPSAESVARLQPQTKILPVSKGGRGVRLKPGTWGGECI
jgi:hypothetical protein